MGTTTRCFTLILQVQDGHTKSDALIVGEILQSTTPQIRDGMQEEVRLGTRSINHLKQQRKMVVMTAVINLILPTKLELL